MKNNILHFFGGSVLGYAALSAESPIPGMDEAIKAIIGIVAGIIGSVVTYYLNKWLVKKNSGK